MSPTNSILELQSSIDRFYQQYSTTRLIQSTLLVGVVSVLMSFATYRVFSNAFAAIAVFAVVGFILINVSIFFILPPTRKLAASKVFILQALKAPDRIEALGGGGVKLTDDSGESRALNRFERRLWEAVVVPYLVQNTTTGGLHTEDKIRKENARKKVLEARRLKLQAEEHEMLDHQKQLELDREDLERRADFLQGAEDKVINRLCKVDAAESELTQLQEDVELRLSSADASDAAENAQLEEKARELAEKESEIERMKRALLEDRVIVEGQKTELNQLKGELLNSSEGGAPMDPEREAELKQREQELVELAEDLEARTSYVTDAEDALISRLNQLSEREAFIEQGEINAGVRSD